MRICILSIAIFVSPIVSAQKCDTVKGRIMNCIDIHSLKQGYWFEGSVSRILTTDSFNRNPGAIGFHNDSGLVYTPIAEGYYKDNKKIGSWTYYVGFYNDPSAHTKTVIFTDSGYRYEIDSFYHYSIKVSDDTSTLAGKIYLKYDTVIVNCNNGKCILVNQSGKKGTIFKADMLADRIRFLNFLSYKVVRKKTTRFTNKEVRRIYSRLLIHQWALISALHK